MAHLHIWKTSFLLCYKSDSTPGLTTRLYAVPYYHHSMATCAMPVVLSAFLSGSRGISVSRLLKLPRYSCYGYGLCQLPHAFSGATPPNRNFFNARPRFCVPPWIPTATHSRDMLSQSGILPAYCRAFFHSRLNRRLASRLLDFFIFAHPL